MKRRQFLQHLGTAGLALQPTVRAVAGLGSSLVDAPRRAGVFLNQLGYLPSGAKQATIVATGGNRRDFQIRSIAGNAVAFQGMLGQASEDAASGDRTSIADFSALKAAGVYRLEFAGALSDPFPIKAQVYQPALRLAMRSYYGQRCGCAVDLGGGYKHPGCHAAGAFHASSGKAGPLANHGGWHDAGDYGRYIVNSGISTGTLLWAWELYPQKLRHLSLDLPESGGKLPDYLSEVLWNLEWMLTLQDTDGGVWHKQTSEHFCGFVMPQDDTTTSYVIGTGNAPYKSTCATGDFAAVMAIAARCYGPFDSGFAQRCLAAARQAWTWAIGHPDVTFRNPSGVSTGGYGDAHCADEIAWASAELWRTTGESQFEKTFLGGLPDASQAETLSAPGWGDVLSMACWTYVLAERPGAASVKARIREATVVAANALIERSRRSGYGNTLSIGDYGWGSNSVAANQSLLLLIADQFHPTSDGREAAFNNLHYLVGRNCHGVSWVTQLGVRPYMHPHHRPSAADGIEAPWPGLLSGGPNARGGDAIADKLPKQPPMQMWVDDQAAYSLNEIAINWNAPLVFLLAAANS